MDKLNYVYILDSAPHLFIGVTCDLEKRVAHPRRKLVWFEPHAELTAAIEREKQLKRWTRSWRVKLVSNNNPEWRDLLAELSDGSSERALEADTAPSKLPFGAGEERRRRYRLV